MPAPACTCILPSLTIDGAQHDAGVHVAGRAEIADAAAVDAALVDFQLVDDLHRAHFWRAGDGAGGKAGGQRVDRVAPLSSLPSTFETMCMTWL